MKTNHFFAGEKYHITPAVVLNTTTTTATAINDDDQQYTFPHCPPFYEVVTKAWGEGGGVSGEGEGKMYKTNGISSLFSSLIRNYKNKY